MDVVLLVAELLIAAIFAIVLKRIPGVWVSLGAIHFRKEWTLRSAGHR